MQTCGAMRFASSRLLRSRGQVQHYLTPRRRLWGGAVLVSKEKARLPYTCISRIWLTYIYLHTSMDRYVHNYNYSNSTTTLTDRRWRTTPTSIQTLHSFFCLATRLPVQPERLPIYGRQLIFFGIIQFYCTFISYQYANWAGAYGLTYKGTSKISGLLCA